MAKIDFGPLIKAAIDTALTTVAADKKNDLAQKDVAKATAVVAKEIKEQVEPVIENQTNQEPVWKSRILRGAVIGLLGLMATVFKDYNDDGTIPLTDLYGYGTTALGFIYVIYGRLTSAGTPTV